MRNGLFRIFVLALSSTLACGNSERASGTATGAGGATSGGGGDGGQGGAGGAAGAGGTGGAGGAAGAGGAGGAGGVCDPPLAEVPPIGTDDVAYDEWSTLGCFGSPCLCAPGARRFIDQVLACEPVAGGYFAGQGSMYLRVAGREGGQCVLDVGTEVEGGVVAHRCRLPLPIAPWPGIASTTDAPSDADGFLAGIEGSCELLGSCCIQDGGPDPCATTLPDVPLCPPAAGPSCT